MNIANSSLSNNEEELWESSIYSWLVRKHGDKLGLGLAVSSFGGGRAAVGLSLGCRDLCS